MKAKEKIVSYFSGKWAVFTEEKIEGMEFVVMIIL